MLEKLIIKFRVKLLIRPTSEFVGLLAELNSANVKAKEVMNENINILKHNESINEAVEIASKYDLMAIPVVDNSDVLIGVVNTHDLIDEVLYPMWKKKNK